jgi:hypothetical protein
MDTYNYYEERIEFYLNGIRQIGFSCSDEGMRPEILGTSVRTQYPYQYSRSTNEETYGYSLLPPWY